MLMLLLSGPLSVGKTSVTSVLVEVHAFQRIRTGAYLANLARQRGIAVNRTILQAIGDGLDQKTDYRWVLDDVTAPMLAAPANIERCLLDSARKARQILHFRNRYQSSVLHIHLTASEASLRERYEHRRASGDDYSDDVPYDVAIQHPNEIAARELVQVADAVIDVSDLRSADVACEVVCRCKENGRFQCVR